MKLADSTIAQIVKLVQLGMLTGTDIVDHFRMLELETNDSGEIVTTADYNEIFQENIEKLQSMSNQGN